MKQLDRRLSSPLLPSRLPSQCRKRTRWHRCVSNDEGHSEVRSRICERRQLFPCRCARVEALECTASPFSAMIHSATGSVETPVQGENGAQVPPRGR
eukprot:scaffold26767_cov33-Tisochrysis_lutea.AAC.2